MLNTLFKSIGLCLLRLFSIVQHLSTWLFLLHKGNLALNVLKTMNMYSTMIDPVSCTAYDLVSKVINQCADMKSKLL